jgi:hypothetical protein
MPRNNEDSISFRYKKKSKYLILEEEQRFSRTLDYQALLYHLQDELNTTLV